MALLGRFSGRRSASGADEERESPLTSEPRDDALVIEADSPLVLPPSLAPLLLLLLLLLLLMMMSLLRLRLMTRMLLLLFVFSILLLIMQF